jgi:hypothetical protein
VLFAVETLAAARNRTLANLQQMPASVFFIELSHGFPFLLFSFPTLLTHCPLQIRWLGLMLFAFRLYKPHPDCLGTTNAVSPNFKFYFFSFSKRIIVHSFKLLAVEEEVFAFRRSDEAKSSV